ncbi:MAG: hypothetical protein HXY24_18565, partial [Rubrivivax sp.]|nr:hypothetical protein [Rubrivivax sp.]
RRAGRRDLEGELTFGEVHLHLAAGDLDAACDAMESALSMSRDVGRHASEAEKLISLGSLQGMTGRIDEALRTFALARQRLDELALGYLQPVLLSSWAVYTLFAGDGEATRALLAECDALLEERGVAEFGSGHLAQLVKETVLTRLRLGEPASALTRLQQAHSWPGWNKVAGHEQVRLATGCLMLEVGRPERVGASFEPALLQAGFGTDFAQARLSTLQRAPEAAAVFWADTPDLARAYPPVTAQCMAVAELAEHAPVERALSELDRLLPAAEARGWHGARVALLATQAVILARAGRKTEARAAASAAGDLGRRYVSMTIPLSVALSCAEAFERCGDAARARACLQRAETIAQAAAAALPEEFRSSYQQRNPVVRRVIEAATQVERVADRLGEASWLRSRAPAALRTSHRR